MNGGTQKGTNSSVGINSVLLTVLGFIVALALSFRSTTAYRSERYSEGRRYWSQLMLASDNLARLVWAHAGEQGGDNCASSHTRTTTA